MIKTDKYRDYTRSTGLILYTSWADLGGGGGGSGPPFLAHDVGFLTLGPKLDTLLAPIFLCL